MLLNFSMAAERELGAAAAAACPLAAAPLPAGYQDHPGLPEPRKAQVRPGRARRAVWVWV